jgi:DNA-binding protein WhiA
MRGESLASDVEGLLCMMSLPPCKATRRNNPLLYYRKSSLVENFLAFIGAGSSVLTIIEEKIVRELRNDTNRQNNLENAMLKRAVSAAVEQISVIKELNKRGLLETLPEDLKVTASLRLLYESATLEQLGAKHMPPISKSGVKHRLEKIKDFYEKYKK